MIVAKTGERWIVDSVISFFKSIVVVDPLSPFLAVAILVLAALVTPPDVITQIILFTVVYGLYEVSIFLVRRVERKREAQLRAEGFYDDEVDGE